MEFIRDLLILAILTLLVVFGYDATSSRGLRVTIDGVAHTILVQ